MRAVGVLVGGTTLAQLITALALPVVARLYTPADFSSLAVISGLLSVLSVAAGLRLELAIPLPERDEDAVNLLALALAFTLLVATLLGVLVLFAPNTIAAGLGQPELSLHLWLLPLGVLLVSSYSALQFWAVRHKQFAPIARTRIGQSVVGSGTQIGLGWIGVAPLGLLLGQVLSAGVGCIGLGWRFFADGGPRLQAVRIDRMRAAFQRYSRFPKFSALEALCNTAGMQIPLIVIAAVALGPEAGYLVMAMAAMQAPMGLIGSAVAQVYFSKAPERHRAGTLDAFTASVFGGLVKSGVGPLLFAGVVAPDAFALIFGEEWKRAGDLVRWMTPWFVMQFLSVPVSMALHVTDNQKAALLLQLCGLTLRTLFVLVAASIAASYVSEAYALSGFVFYAIYLIVVIRVVGVRLTDILRELGRGIWITLIWIGLALLVNMALKYGLALWLPP